MRPSLKRTVLIFANYNSVAYFLAFVIVAANLPPCWKKDGVSGEGNIGAPAYNGFFGTHHMHTLTVSALPPVTVPYALMWHGWGAGSDNIGSWGPDPGWTICIITFFLVCLPYSAVSLGIYFGADPRDAPIPERRPRAGDAKPVASATTSSDFRGSVVM